MKFTVDTATDGLDEVLRVVEAAYGRSVGVARGAADAPVEKGPRRRRSASRGAQPPTASQIRAWANENGWQVNVRGALPRPVVAAYHEAHGA